MKRVTLRFHGCRSATHTGITFLLCGLSVISPIRGSVSAAPCATIEDVAYPAEVDADNIPFLHLRRGALIESIAFSSAYLRAAPNEDCIVLVRPEGTQIGGVAVYTKGNRLYLRSVATGVLLLPGLGAADINTPEKIISSMTSALKEAKRLTYPTTDESDEVQLQKAARAVSFFPSTLNEVGISIVGRDHSTPGRKTRVLVLDWNQKHYVWNPTIGVIDVPVPVDPLTHAPWLCVENAELPGSVLFAAEYARLHPGEKAEVLLDPVLSSHPLVWFARGAALAAYTDNDQVRIHTPYANITLPDATKADFSDFPSLTAKAFARYHSFLAAGGYRNALAPAGLIGDTDDLQLRRAHFRLQVANARPGKIHGGRSVLVVHCGNLQLAYAPDHGVAYSGWLPPYRALLIDGIVFAGRYRKAHPDDKIVVIAHPPPGRVTYPQGGIDAHVFYTKGGGLWGHIGQDHAGEYRVAGAMAAAIGNRPQLIDLCTNNQSMADKSARVVASLFAGKYRQTVDTLPAYDGRPFDADAVAGDLKEQGVPCKIVRERERTEDGRIIEYPADAVLFQWAGERFVYARQKIFRARARGYPSDMALN